MDRVKDDLERLSDTVTAVTLDFKSSLQSDVRGALIKLHQQRATRPGNWFSRNLTTLARAEYGNSFLFRVLPFQAVLYCPLALTTVLIVAVLLLCMSALNIRDLSNLGLVTATTYRFTSLSVVPAQPSLHFGLLLNGCPVSVENSSLSTTGSASTITFLEPTSSNGWFIELDADAAVPERFKLEASTLGGSDSVSGWALVGAPSRRFTQAAYFDLQWVFLTNESFSNEQVWNESRIPSRQK